MNEPRAIPYIIQHEPPEQWEYHLLVAEQGKGTLSIAEGNELVNTGKWSWLVDGGPNGELIEVIGELHYHL